MNIDQFILDILKNSKSISCEMYQNTIRADGIVYSLSNCILESQWSNFCPDHVTYIDNFDYSFSGAVDKSSKLKMDKRVSIHFKSGQRITIEYNDQVEISKNEKLTEDYETSVKSVTAVCQYKDSKFIETIAYKTLNNGNEVYV